MTTTTTTRTTRTTTLSRRGDSVHRGGGGGAWMMGWTTALLLFVLRFWERHHHDGNNNDNHDDSMYQWIRKWLWTRQQTRQKDKCILHDDGNVETDKKRTQQEMNVNDKEWKDESPTIIMVHKQEPTAARANRKSSCTITNRQTSNVASSSSSSSSSSPPTTGSSLHSLDHVTLQQGRIRDILRYWFGQYTPALAQKKLWMISNQAAAYRAHVDGEIVQRFGRYLSYNNNNNNNKNEKSQQEPIWREWCQDDNDSMYGIHGKVAAIVLLDQLGRHVHRFLQETSVSLCADNNNNNNIANNHQRLTSTLRVPPQATLDAAALEIAQSIIRVQDKKNENGTIETTTTTTTTTMSDLSLLSTPMQIFAFMPFRHANQVETLQIVQKQIQAWSDLQEQHGALLGRFRKATHRRLAVLQDEARRTGQGKTKTSSTNFVDEDILETLPFAVDDMTPATKHVVYTTLEQFLTHRGVTKENFSDPNQKCPIIVSLSGGVDSMVICAVLAHLAETETAPIRVVAVHIDYANRPESAAEATYCRDWCAAHKVDFYVRRIDQVTRGVTARDAYEKISRQVRYSFYRQTIQQYTALTDNEHTIGVVLGHHRGDLRENVLSNAHKGSGPLDLSGMTAVSWNDGVTLYRPLLPLEKTAIFDYAHRFGVPYFKDTTPHWSTRGKLRNRLLPLLEEIYGEGCLSNLSNLAVESDECRELLQEVSFGPFMDQIQRKPMGMILSTTPWKDQGLFFWKFVLREALHSGGFGMFSDKAVVSFLERVLAGKEGWLQCRKDYAVYLQADGQVFIWKPDRFPWHKKDQYKVDGQTVEYGRHHAIAVGPWQITALLAPMVGSQRDEPNESSTIRNEMVVPLQNRALDSMLDLMEGSLTYYVQVPTWEQDDGSLAPRPLVFRKFTKSSRPLAWKSTDTRIQDTLPLLGNDDEALGALHDPISAGAVYINENGETVPTPTELVKVTVRLTETSTPTSPPAPVQ